jgi:hypothetical protein
VDAAVQRVREEVGGLGDGDQRLGGRPEGVPGAAEWPLSLARGSGGVFRDADTVRQTRSKLYTIVQDLDDRTGPAVYGDPTGDYIHLQGLAFGSAADDLEDGIRRHVVEFSPRLQAECDGPWL